MLRFPMSCLLAVITPQTKSFPMLDTASPVKLMLTWKRLDERRCLEEVCTEAKGSFHSLQVVPVPSMFRRLNLENSFFLYPVSVKKRGGEVVIGVLSSKEPATKE